MITMTFDEIIALAKTCVDVAAACEEGFSDYDDKFGEDELVDSYGGEGQGDEYWAVWYLRDHNIYIKIEGWYASHAGTDFGSWDTAATEVIPIEKMITVYEPKIKID